MPSRAPRPPAEAEAAPFEQPSPADAEAPAGSHIEPAGGGIDTPRRPSTGGRGSGFLIIVLIAALLVGLVIVLFFEPGLVETGFTSDDDTEASAASQRAVLVRATLMEQAPPISDLLGAASPIYEIAVPAGRLGPFEFSLRLTNPSQDSRNLGAYTWNGGDWVRLGDAVLASDGVSARVRLASAPDNIAILRRLQFRDVIAARVPRGEEPQSLLSGSLTLLHPDGWRPGADGSLLGLVDLPASVIAQNVWPTISAGADQTELVNDILASDNLRRQHIGNIQHAIQSGQHDGVDIHYLNVSPALRTQFTSFIAELADRLHRDDRGLSVHIPINASGGVGEGAYDLSQLGASADFVVIEPPLDPTMHQAAIAASLPTLLERIESNKLLLSLKSNAVVRTSSGYSEITQREALGIASDLSIREPGPYTPSSRVTLQGAAIMLDNLSSGLRWDDVNRIVSFSYSDQTGSPVTIYIHNRFSAAFQMQAVSDWELGGIYIANASADPGNANLWPAIAAFFESGVPDLRLPNAILFDPVFSVEEGVLSGNSSSGWQFWELPTEAGSYRAQLVVSDGDVRVGHEITVPVGIEAAQ